VLRLLMVVRRSISRGLRGIGIVVGGFCVLFLGLALIVVPVPGTSIVVFPLGLAILARELAWAERLLTWSKDAQRHGWARLCRAFGTAAASAP
jgi:hypothetical protein